MGFLGSLLSSTIKIVLTPVAITMDLVDVIKGDEPDNTKKLIDSAINDLSDSIKDIDSGF